MSSPDYSTKDALATLACQKLVKGKKKPNCNCEPCMARILLFGQNVAIVIQEAARDKPSMTLHEATVLALQEAAEKARKAAAPVLHSNLIIP